ncbi:hypothetical protein, partial [Klebsiella oxytoca]|uniref:hypothetical protein n=1 Tax=Klebsiella oxytoca TaxID=571 RepID=UPI003D9EF029
MPAFEWVHVQLHQQKGMISLSPPTICNSAIDGHVEGWFTDDTAKRFEAYGWHVVRGVDGHDADSIKRAVE